MTWERAWDGRRMPHAIVRGEREGEHVLRGHPSVAMRFVPTVGALALFPWPPGVRLERARRSGEVVVENVRGAAVRTLAHGKRMTIEPSPLGDAAFRER